MVKYFCDFNLTLIFYILKEPKKAESEYVNFTLFELIDAVRTLNMSNDYSKNILVRDASKIDTAVDAASFLVGIIQTYLGKKDSKESPAGINTININIENHSCGNVNATTAKIHN